MKPKRHGHKDYFINLIFPAFVFGAITGVLTAVTVAGYKWCAGQVIGLSQRGYEWLQEHWYAIPIALGLLLGAALLIAYLHRKLPNIRGGGIPTAIGMLRGQIPFRGLRNFIGIILMSLGTFLIGVPLDYEAPSVLIGTLIGHGGIFTLAKKHRAWNRYSMTGGACAGFSSATGAPITGIMFAVEEAHKNVSPMIIMVAATSVMFANMVSGILSPVLGVSEKLFPAFDIPSLRVEEYWVAFVIGIVVGLFAAGALRYYHAISRLFTTTLAKIPLFVKIFAVFAITLILGVCSRSFISNGHAVIEGLFHHSPAIWMLALWLILRLTNTFAANHNGITGGLTLPTMALGAILGSIVGKIGVVCGLDERYLGVMIVLGMTACIAGMMKVPITAIVFSIEVLSCSDNILPVIIAAAISFIITEVFHGHSINHSVMENRIEELREGKTATVVDMRVTVQPSAFAIGKQVRDIFWPSDLFVLSIRHCEETCERVDGHGEKVIRAGDILHVHYSTYDDEITKDELYAIVGEQPVST